MTMLGAGIIIVVVAFSAVGFLWVLPSWRRHRGTWVVTCPETRKAAGVEVDAARVAATAWGGEPDVRLKACSLWPEKAACGRACLSGIEREAKRINAAWYRSQACVLCGKQIPGALADPFSPQKPVCWDCHVALSVVRERGELPVLLPERKQAYG